ncbi:MAG: helix-hairpin-helix domain-containing protein, partial [candidate division WOR-3 bacterium]
GPRQALLDMAQRNAELARLTRQQATGPRHAVVELAQALGLNQPPSRIEGLDISNLSGQDAVGSLVVFEQGRPLKSEYRRFHIRMVGAQDDCAMLCEVLSRRMKQVLANGKPLADLVLVDGGKGQLSAALRVYQESGTAIPVLGFAKRTDTIYCADGREIQIPSHSPALSLLKRVRDEAHRFAIAGHRSLRAKRVAGSVLDAIPGIGQKRRNALLKYFGSLKRLEQAEMQDLSQVMGIGRNLAAQIYSALRQHLARKT